MLAWAQHAVCVVALPIGVVVRIEARVKRLVESPIAAEASNMILQVQML